MITAISFPPEEPAGFRALPCPISGTVTNGCFKLAIIDEASQATEPGSIGVLLCGVDRLILVGDPMQLGYVFSFPSGPFQPPASSFCCLGTNSIRLRNLIWTDMR